MTAPVIVGVDGSDPSLHAARYAALVAGQRGAPLTLVHGWFHPYAAGPDLYGMVPFGMEEAAGRLVEEVAGTLRADYPELEVGTRIEPGSGGRALIKESANAGLAVVGARGHGGFAELLLGSVASQVAGHAQCPVLIVREEHELALRGPVVVGADGSATSLAALTEAADEARARDTTLDVVFAWWVDSFAFPLTAAFEDVEAQARAEAESVMERAVAHVAASHPELTVKPRLERSLNPEHTMVEASQGAGLVVAGSRGRGGIAGLLLGSVSQALVHHAACPVLVARAVPEEAA